MAAGVTLAAYGLGLSGASSADTAGALLACPVALVPLRALKVGSRSMARGGDGRKGLDRYALPAPGANACLMAISGLDQIAVAHFSSNDKAGHYAVAFRLGRVISLSAIAMAWVLFTMSVLKALTDPGRRLFFVHATLIVGGMTLGLVSACILAPAHTARLIGGGQYQAARQDLGLVGLGTTLFCTHLCTSVLSDLY